EAKEIKTDLKVVVSEAKEIKTDTKVVVSETKEMKNSKILIKQNKESENDKIVALKTPELDKQKAIKNNFQSTIVLQKNNDLKEVQHSPIKTETSSEKIEVETESSDKTAISTETKTHNIDKTKSTPDIKKTFSTFAEEFKEKVENYKAPLMKIKMELKPAGLGEVDVTLLSRGNTLQVNINSNSSTIAMFMQNQTEFKNSLINMGFSDLQMNFSEQQKKEQDSQNQKNGKNVFELHEENEEQDGFEMIIPRYV
ncbi:MAG TPA: flagellar hook-length control protein FliK, partial [Campylobacterales bacterium]|nr:flagellar hook-length control protein FliK [Campylobacterales bacterium]